MNKKIIEALLFSSGKIGLSLDELSIKMKIDSDKLQIIIDETISIFISDDSTSLMIKKFGSKYKLVTKKEIIHLLNSDSNILYKNPLSNSLLEILAIIAYHVPCKRSTIFELRKKDPSESIKKLITMGFVSDLGRSDAQGKPFVYGITDLFYDTFGVSSLDELPKIEESNSLNEELDIDFFDMNREQNEN